MELTKLSLRNYRNFDHLDLELPPGLSVISGHNAVGKSNLLESVFMLAIAKSYRATSERELVAWSTAERGGWTTIEGNIKTETSIVNLMVGLECSAGGARKHIRVNDIPKRSSGLIGLASMVLFNADDIDMVFGSPRVRRRYLDVMLCQANKQYVAALQRYQSVVTQRNYLMRSSGDKQIDLDELRQWNRSLCSSGAVILAHRIEAIERITKVAEETYRRLAGNEQQLSLKYVSTVPSPDGTSIEEIEQKMMGALEESLHREKRIGFTLVGPHRDDLGLEIDGVEMSRHASRGQARLAALALRLSEGELLAEDKMESPILLFDDVFSELDDVRRRTVLDEAKRYHQSLLTITDLGILPNLGGGHANYFNIQRGQIHANAI